MSPPRRRRPSASAAAQHVAWMGLLDVTGPFLSVSVLTEAFPQGLDADDPEIAARLAQAFSEWEASDGDLPLHRAFIRFVLTEVLEYAPDQLLEGPAIPENVKAELQEHRLALRPDLLVCRADGTPALCIVVQPPGEQLERQTSEGGLSASPAERARLLLRGSGVRTALVTNGEQWMLVHAPANGTATFATWQTPLLTEERETLRAFRSLIGSRRVVGQADADTLDGLLARSADDEREVTDALGDQTRRAVELLVGAFDSADQESGGALLSGIEPPTLYEAVVAATMRIIFLLAAEGQHLLPDDEAWTEAYAVTPMRARLQEEASRHGEEVLERRFDAWARLCATFRAVHGGVTHDRVRIPGYGGGLFDPARFPFLDGPERPPRISNRVVLRVLDNLQTLEVAVPGGGRESRPLSFSALGVEQIGHVYERLLEHTAVRTDGAALGLTGTGRKEPEVALEHLEELQITGDEALLGFLRDQTGRSLAALQRDLAKEPSDRRQQQLRTACEGDEDLLERITPFAGLVRDNAYDRPCVFLAGRIYVTERAGGRAFQSHYTPPGLTEPIVEHALLPVVYEGPAEGWEQAIWRLKSPAELLDLKVADIAMGSAAFLVAAVRYLAARLVESWDRHPDQAPANLPLDAEEGDLLARRRIAEQCVYGVDKNPLAVDIAKVSLWLVTLQRDRPFTFLDHALRCGDSLVGVTEVAQLERLALGEDPAPRLLSAGARTRMHDSLVEVRTLRSLVSGSDAVDLRALEEKQAVLRRAEERTTALRAVADLVTGAALACAGTRTDPGILVEEHSTAIEEALDGRPVAPLALSARELLLAGRMPGDTGDMEPLHWPLEFPEVFTGDSPGFDAIIGNPPFLGGSALTGTFGRRFREYLVYHLAGELRGNADLCAYFFLRGHDLLTRGGCLALLATNTIAQGDTREVGIGQLAGTGAAIYRASPSRPWPGQANLEIAEVWLRRGTWRGAVSLAGREVTGITTGLSPRGRVTGDPYRLAASSGAAFNGAKVYGQGFVLTPDEAQTMIAREPRNKDVVFPYLNGEDLQSRPDQSPSRWVINFHDWPRERAAEYPEPYAIAERLVRPERERNNRAIRRERWWQFAERAPALSAALVERPLAFARALTSNTHAVCSIDSGLVVSHAAGVFCLDDWGEFAAIQSSIHEAWIWRQASSMRTDVRYTPSDCFETFPFPDPLPPGDTAHRLHDLRADCTRARCEGLTKLMNRVNDPTQSDGHLIELRELVERLDREVADAYGWTSLDLNHDFHETRFGVRFTIGPDARNEVLERLLELNHERYAEEVRLGLHAKARPKTSRRPKKTTPPSPPDQESLFSA